MAQLVSPINWVSTALGFGDPQSDEDEEEALPVKTQKTSSARRRQQKAFIKKYKDKFSADELITFQQQARSGDALFKAALEGNVHEVGTLIDNGASVNAPCLIKDAVDGDSYVTLLHVLSSRPDLPGNEEILAKIVDARANLNARNSLGSTPLTRACSHKNVGAAETLMRARADPEPIDDRGRNALQCAISLDVDVTFPAASSADTISGELVALLMSYGAKPDQGGKGSRPPLLEAIHQANQPAVRSLLHHGAIPRYLSAAIGGASLGIIEELLKGGADPWETNEQGMTALDTAFHRGDEDIIAMLREFIGDRDRTAVMRPDNRSQLAPEEQHALRGSVDELTLGLLKEVERPSTSDAASEAAPSTSSPVRPRQRRLSLDRSSFLRKVAPRTLAELAEVQAARDAERGFWVRFGAHRLQSRCGRLVKDRNFAVVMTTALLTVLFIPDLWIILDIESSAGLDTILVVVFLLFLLELVAQTIGMPKTYVNSFFFWMDIVGILSVPLDLSFVSDNLPNNLADNATIMRAARTARLGARAGRFTKLVKLLRCMPGVNLHDNRQSLGTAKVMRNSLVTSVSTRVSCLLIVMVMVLPLFELLTYPENDFSMKTWMNSLDSTLRRHGSHRLDKRVKQLQQFYENKDYYPYEIYWTAENGTAMYRRLLGLRPATQRSRTEIQADSGSVTGVFNFGPQLRINAWCNVILLCMVICLMIGFAMLLSNSVSKIVLEPLEHLLDSVQRMAAKLFKSVNTLTNTGDKDVPGDTNPRARGAHDTATRTLDIGDDDDIAHETLLLRKVIDKLAALSAITLKTSPVDADIFQTLAAEDLAVLARLQGDESGRRNSAVGTDIKRSPSICVEDLPSSDELANAVEKSLEGAGLAWEHLDTWDFDPLAMDDRKCNGVCFSLCVFHLSNHYSGRQQEQTLREFVEVAARAYAPSSVVPFHNFRHATDVAHAVFRHMQLCSAECFISTHERFALVVSAICHDVGHGGLNNPFLVETSHELAVRYNDQSPLENMHCAKLFEIASQPETAIFGHLDKSLYREVRLTCIEAILHTDNVCHFALVKDIQMIYEMNSSVFDIALQMCQTSELDFPPREICDILCEPDKKTLIRNVFVHYSDIANPTKPFELSKKWAWIILDEFFLQGDKEKELGITVQPLNDRSKVNRAYAQVGFVEFFLSPLAFAFVRIFPPLLGSADQMMLNLKLWSEEWRTTSEPAPNQEEVAKIHERLEKLEGKFAFKGAV